MFPTCLGLILITYVHLLEATLKDDIYQNIKDFYPCVYYSGVNGGVGCSSSRNGNNGKLYPINNQSDLSSFTKKTPNENIIAYVNDAMFKLNTIEILEKSKYLQGIIVRSNPAIKNVDFSPESMCPDESLSQKSCKGIHWNPIGNNMMYRQFNYPIFLVDNPKEIEKIDNCLFEFKDATNCGVEMSSFMNSKGQTSKICLSRNDIPFMSDYFCRHIVGDSYWASVGDYINDFEKSSEVIMLSAILDGRSMFLSKDLNAESSLTGLISLLSVSHILGHWKRNNNIVSKMNKNVIILLNNKETFEFTGSKALAYRMKHSRFPSSTAYRPLSLKNISAFIDFNQMAFIQNDSNPLYLHSNKNNGQLMNKIVAHLSAQGLNSAPSSVNSKADNELPPSSFVAFNKADPNIEGVVLTDFDTQFTNKRYRSYLDNEKYINLDFTKSGNVVDKKLIKKLENVSIGMAKAVLELSGVPAGDISALKLPTELMVQTLFTCIVHNTKCSLFHEIYKSNINDKSPLSRSPHTDNHLIYKRLLAYFLGTVDSPTKTPLNCSSIAQFGDARYYNFEGSTNCVYKASVLDFDSIEVGVDSVPCWTISANDAYVFRIYVIPSSMSKYLTLVIGLVTTCLSIGVSIYLTRLYKRQMN